MIHVFVYMIYFIPCILLYAFPLFLLEPTG